MTQTAFVGDEVVSRYLFGFSVDLGQRQTTFFTVSKHWARVVFHDSTPDFSCQLSVQTRSFTTIVLLGLAIEHIWVA